MRKVNTIKIGKFLQSIRKSNGYTQEKLAEKIDVSVRYISDIEQDRSMPSFEVLIRICNIFKISLDQVFSEYLKVKKNKIRARIKFLTRFYLNFQIYFSYIFII